MKVHHGGKFTSRPNRKYVFGKHVMFYQFKRPNKTLDWGLRALGKDDEIVNLIKYVSQHKGIEEDNEKGLGQGIDGDNEQGIDYGNEGDNEMGSDKDYDRDNEINNDMGSDEMGNDHSIEMVADQGDEMGSEHGGVEEEFSDHADDNIVDKEHIIDELEVNMEGFRYTVDDHLVLETLHPEVNVIENDLEFIYFDSFDSDIGDDSNSEWRAALRKLKKEEKQNSSQSRIANYFFVRQEFLNKEEAKKRIKSDPVESSNANQGYTRLNEKKVIGPLKEGFKAGGRELLGLYGAFMKGQYSRKLLIAVGVDGNNGIYPMPYRILESESLDSWKWFLTQLGDDLELYSNSK
ncbi:mutator type transposase, partial [Tanacetum coccineum]